MGATRIYFVATVLLFVLNGACLVKGAATDSMTTSYSTSDGNSTSGMNNATIPADNSATSNNSDRMVFPNQIAIPDIGITCLVCDGDNGSNCNHASPTSIMEDIYLESECSSCRIYKTDTGKGTTITQIVRGCNQTSCPAYLKDEYDFGCFRNTTHRICEWCCKDNNCNNFNRNRANALVAAVVLGGWTITKVVYVVVSTIAVAMSMSTMV